MVTSLVNNPKTVHSSCIIKFVTYHSLLKIPSFLSCIALWCLSSSELIKI